MPEQDGSGKKCGGKGKNTLAVLIWHKIIQQLNQLKCKYLLVGGTALVIHGLPRSTLDLDIYAPAEEITLTKIFTIAQRLKLHTDQQDILKICHSPKLFADQWICFSYQGYDVLDVFLAGEEEFNRLYKNSETKRDGNLSVRVVSLSDLAKMKRVSGRAVDVADVDLITKAQRYKKI